MGLKAFEVHEASVQARLARWPPVMLDDVSLAAMRDARLPVHAKWAALRWLLNGNRVALRWESSSSTSQPHRCSLCQLPTAASLFPLGRCHPGLCGRHYGELYEATCGVPGVVYAAHSGWLLALDACFPNSAQLGRAALFSALDSSTTDGLPACPLCGCGIDDEGHRVCWCPVVQAACQVATGQPWSFNALGQIPTSQFADFLSAVHSWAPGLRLPDADSPHQPAWCLARVRSLLSHRWMRQPLPSRTEGARTRLRQLGVRLTPSRGHLPELEFILAPSAVHVDWLEFTACQLRVVSRDDRFRLIASLMRTALCPTGSAICRSCRAAASVRKLIRRALAGAHLLRAAPRLDTGSYRRVSVGALGPGQCLAQWVSTGMGEALFCGGSSPPLLRQVAIGLDYNVVVSHELGGCGATRYSIHAVRPVRPGEELISSITPPGISSSGSLLLTTDGGGNKGAVGCAVVGFVVAHGRYTHLDTVVISMPAGEPPQEAEAHGLYSALLARPHFLHKAHALGLQPLEPDFIASDSKNSVHSALGQARLRHPKLQQWAAGVLHFRCRDLRILLPTMVQAQQCSWCETRRLGLTVSDAPFRLA